MEFNVLIRTVYESNDDETKYELIEDLKKQIESHQQVILPELRRLFMMLSETLAGAKKDNLILLLHQTISTLIRVLLSQEIELNFKYILQPLINNLAEPDQSIRRSTKLVIDNFLKKTRNIELIIDYLIKYGFSSENYFLREKSIGSSVRFLDICQNIFCSRSGLNDVRRLIENIIIKLNDSVENVRIKAQKVLYKIMKQKNYEGFLQVQRRLSKEHQQQMENVVNKKHLEQEDQKIKELYEKFGEINLHMFEDYQQDFIVENTDGIRKYYLYQEMPQFTKKQILSFFPLGMNGLYFNLIREDTLIDCFNESDLRVKIQASKEVLEAFEACETPEDTINDIRSYLGAFYKFITYLLSSKNLIISGNAMKIVSTLIQHSAGMQMKAYIILALPPLIGKLGEERINIRNTAFFIVRSMITSIKKHTLLKSFCLFLNDQLNNQTNPNWHIKEEILNLISVLFLCLFDGYPEEWYENAFIKELQGDDANSICFQLYQKNIQQYSRILSPESASSRDNYIIKEKIKERATICSHFIQLHLMQENYQNLCALTSQKFKINQRKSKKRDYQKPYKRLINNQLKVKSNLTKYSHQQNAYFKKIHTINQSQKIQGQSRNLKLIYEKIIFTKGFAIKKQITQNNKENAKIINSFLHQYH